MNATAEELLTTALLETGYDVTQPPARGDADTYLAWEFRRGELIQYSANNARRLRNVFSVNLYSRESPESETVIGIVRTLFRHGIAANNWGPVYYDTELHRYQMPITCEIVEKFEQQGE